MPANLSAVAPCRRARQHIVTISSRTGRDRTVQCRGRGGVCVCLRALIQPVRTAGADSCGSLSANNTWCGALSGAMVRSLQCAGPGGCVVRQALADYIAAPFVMSWSVGGALRGSVTTLHMCCACSQAVCSPVGSNGYEDSFTENRRPLSHSAVPTRGLFRCVSQT